MGLVLGFGHFVHVTKHSEGTVQFWYAIQGSIEVSLSATFSCVAKETVHKQFSESWGCSTGKSK